jgi:hypothetical protein
VAAAAAAVVIPAGPDLPPAAECPTLSKDERARLAQRLRQLGRRLGVDLPQGDSAATLTDALARLDARLDALARHRYAGALPDWGPLQRQLGALLWKHDVPGYNARGLNTVEMVDKLEARLGREGIFQEGARE